MTTTGETIHVHQYGPGWVQIVLICLMVLAAYDVAVWLWDRAADVIAEWREDRRDREITFTPLPEGWKPTPPRDTPPPADPCPRCGGDHDRIDRREPCPQPPADPADAVLEYMARPDVRDGRDLPAWMRAVVRSVFR
jgi:hypothetical protein